MVQAGGWVVWYGFPWSKVCFFCYLSLWCWGIRQDRQVRRNRAGLCHMVAECLGPERSWLGIVCYSPSPPGLLCHLTS
jgi:hypothetical protein